MCSHVHQKADIRMFIETLFLMATQLESTPILSAVEWVNNFVLYLHGNTKLQTIVHATTWINPRDAMLGNTSRIR